MRVLALGLCTATTHALAVGTVGGGIPLLRCTAPALRVMMSSDEALWASLKARIAVSEDESAAPPPLGIDDVGADCMGPADVVEHVMRSMKADADAGATSLMSFAVKYDGDKTEVRHRPPNTRPADATHRSATHACAPRLGVTGPSGSAAAGLLRYTRGAAGILQDEREVYHTGGPAC